MNRRSAASALLVVVSLPLFTGCYTTVATKSGVTESITARVAKPVTDRIDLAANRQAADAPVDVVARRTRLCRTQVTGTRTPYTDTYQAKTEIPWILGFLLAPAGGGMIAFGQTDKDDGLLYGGIAAVALGFTMILLPFDTHSHDVGEPASFSRLEGDPFVCPGIAPEGVANLPVEVTASFARAKDSIWFTTKTDASGASRLTLPWVALTASHCGEANVVVAPPAASLPAGAFVGSVAKWTVPAGAPVELGAASAPDLAITLARSCCTAAAALKVHDACEERCTTTAMVEGCLFARRACELKASRAGPDVAEGRKVCGELYEQCVVANGALLPNVVSCVDGCAAEQPSTCR